MDRDEPRNAGCAAEMAARGDWVVPWFNDELREHKPVLLYWLMMSAYAVFGVNEFAARFWSAALAVGTVLMTYHIGRRLFNPAAACWSAVVLATAFMFVVSARIATPDSVLIFCGTLSLLVFVYGTFRPRSADVPDAPPELRSPGEYYPHRRWVVVGMFAAMGLGVLAKGPIGVLLPTAIVGMFLLIMRLPVTDDASAMDGTRPQLWWVRGGALLRPFAPRHFLGTCASMRPLTAVLTVLIVALPWYAWVGLRTDGDWLRGFFGEHNLSRALAAKEGHDGSLLYYPVAILIGFFSLVSVPVADLVGHREKDPLSGSVDHRLRARSLLGGCIFGSVFTRPNEITQLHHSGISRVGTVGRLLHLPVESRQYAGVGRLALLFSGLSVPGGRLHCDRPVRSSEGFSARF